MKGLALGPVRFDYGVEMRFALRFRHFEITEGKCAFLHGRSGCGKTTLIRLLAGLQGDIGRQVRSQFKSMSLVAHQSGLLPWRSVLQNVELEESLRSREMIEEFRTLTTRLELSSEVLSAKASYLSLGMRQRVELAMAIAARPQLLLLDEGLSGLDPKSKRAAKDLLDENMREHGLCIVATAHDVLDVLSLGDTVWPIDDGEVNDPIELSPNRSERLAMIAPMLLRLPCLDGLLRG